MRRLICRLAGTSFLVVAMASWPAVGHAQGGDYLQRATDLAKSEDYAAALGVMEEGMKAEPANQRFIVLAGDYSRKLGKIDVAVEWYKKAAKLSHEALAKEEAKPVNKDAIMTFVPEPEDWEAFNGYFLAAETLWEAGDKEKARESLRAYHSMGKKREFIQLASVLGKAWFLRRDGKEEDARKVLGSIGGWRPKDYSVFDQAADWFVTRDKAIAVQMLERYIQELKAQKMADKKYQNELIDEATKKKAGLEKANK